MSFDARVSPRKPARPAGLVAARARGYRRNQIGCRVMFTPSRPPPRPPTARSASSRAASRQAVAPAPHVHNREDEAFYLISGELSTCSTAMKPSPPSLADFIFVPRGSLHRFLELGSTHREVAHHVPSRRLRGLLLQGRRRPRHPVWLLRHGTARALSDFRKPWISSTWVHGSTRNDANGGTSNRTRSRHRPTAPRTARSAPRRWPSWRRSRWV